MGERKREREIEEKFLEGKLWNGGEIFGDRGDIKERITNTTWK